MSFISTAQHHAWFEIGLPNWSRDAWVAINIRLMALESLCGFRLGTKSQSLDRFHSCKCTINGRLEHRKFTKLQVSAIMNSTSISVRADLGFISIRSLENITSLGIVNMRARSTMLNHTASPCPGTASRAIKSEWPLAPSQRYGPSTTDPESRSLANKREKYHVCLWATQLTCMWAAGMQGPKYTTLVGFAQVYLPQTPPALGPIVQAITKKICT